MRRHLKNIQVFDLIQKHTWTDTKGFPYNNYILVILKKVLKEEKKLELENSLSINDEARKHYVAMKINMLNKLKWLCSFELAQWCVPKSGAVCVVICRAAVWDVFAKLDNNMKFSVSLWRHDVLT